MNCIKRDCQVKLDDSYYELTFGRSTIRVIVQGVSRSVVLVGNSGTIYPYHNKQNKNLILNSLKSMLQHFRVCENCKLNFKETVEGIINRLK